MSTKVNNCCSIELLKPPRKTKGDLTRLDRGQRHRGGLSKQSAALDRDDEDDEDGAEEDQRESFGPKVHREDRFTSSPSAHFRFSIVVTFAKLVHCC